MIKRRTLVLMLLLLSGSALADDFVGQASVVDGDTLEIHGIRIRLWGVDAPENSQLCRGEDSLQYRCGAQAANDLDTFIARRPANCLPLSLDPYGRTVATCSVGGADLGEWLVRNGRALDWLQYSKGRYGAAQHDAERSGRGIWGRQLCGAVAVSRVHPRRWFAGQLFGRCERPSLSAHATNRSFGRLVAEPGQSGWRDLHDSR
jgi:endonuclease YncB( thermonuclease family)